MKSPLLALPGERIVLPPLTCIRRSHYERELKKGDKLRANESRVVWRYVFVCKHTGHKVVYSGSWLHGVELDKKVYIKATVKRHEPEWGQTRIARPRLLNREEISFDF